MVRGYHPIGVFTIGVLVMDSVPWLRILCNVIAVILIGILLVQRWIGDEPQMDGKRKGLPAKAPARLPQTAPGKKEF